MPDDGMNIGYGRGGRADGSDLPDDDSPTPPEAHNDKQRRVLAERGNVERQQRERMDPRWSGEMVRRPLRTIPLVPLEGASGISPRKDSAQAVWNYIGDTDEIMPVAPAAPASASELDEAINDESLIQTQPTLRRIQSTGEYVQRRLQRYPDTGERELHPIPARRRRLARTSSLEQEAEPVAIALPLPTTTPLSSPYDRLLPTWEQRRKRDTIFLTLLTLLVLSILGIIICNYLLSLYHL